MKTYEEMTQNVLTRKKDYLARRKKRTAALSGVCSVACLALLIVGGTHILSDDKTPTFTPGPTAGSVESLGPVDTAPASPLTQEASTSGSLPARTENAIPIAPVAPIPTEENTVPAAQGEVNLPYIPSFADTAAPTAPVSPPGSADPTAPVSPTVPTPPTVISSYGSDGAFAAYLPPKNGEVSRSVALTKALRECTGENVLFRVAVELLRDESTRNVSCDDLDAERQRLYSLGYTAALETFFDGENEFYHLSFFATREQMESFTPLADFGYMLYLYDELMGSTSPTDLLPSYNAAVEEIAPAPPSVIFLE